MLKRFSFPLLGLCAALTLSACGMDAFRGESDGDFPQRKELDRNEKRGKLTGDGLTLGGSDDEQSGGNNPLGVNSFLWRATLDTLAFMPLASADPFGGVVLTDWYENPNARGERFKVNALILDRQLRADGVKISVFKQHLSAEPGRGWVDSSVDNALGRKLEDTILTRARQMRVKNLK